MSEISNNEVIHYCNLTLLFMLKLGQKIQESGQVVTKQTTRELNKTASKLISGQTTGGKL